MLYFHTNQSIYTTDYLINVVYKMIAKGSYIRLKGKYIITPVKILQVIQI